MNDSEIRNVHNNWESIWKKHGALNKGKFSLPKKLYAAIFPQSFSTISIINIINKEIHTVSPTLENLWIVECGCGTGLISRQLAQKGAHLHLFDISPASLELAQHNFDQKKIKSSFSQASIFEIPYKNEGFHIVISCGVLEHFSKQNQKEALSEMIRIVKKGGLLITIHPSTSGKIYVAMKKRAEKLGIWQAGFEEAMSTISDGLPPHAGQLKEYTCGYISQFLFCKYLFSSLAFRYGWTFIFECLARFFRFMEKYPGYMLVSVVKKKD